MDVDDHFGAEDLFAHDDNVNREDNDDRQDEPAEEGNAAFEGKVEDGGKKKEEEKKRIILNPQPKLDPTRICGTRGIGILQDAYSDFKPKGGDHVFEDLDKAMKRMEHWAHRLYPMLPFDDVMARISVLGKKMAVHTTVQKMRMGMTLLMPREELNEVEDEVADIAMDDTKRYDNDDEFPTEDIFEQLVREADEAMQPKQPEKNTLTEEQRERMLRNRQVAEEKRLARKKEKEMLAKSQELVISDDDAITFITTKDKSQEEEEEEEEEVEEQQPLSQVFNGPSKNSTEMVTTKDKSQEEEEEWKMPPTKKIQKWNI